MKAPHPSLRIVIADDHRLVREGLRNLLELQPGLDVVGEAADGAEALRRVAELHPDVLLLDIAMPHLNGLEVLRELAGSAAGVKIVLLTASIEVEEIAEALRLGARGVVLKDAAADELYECIGAVVRGNYWVGRERIGDLLQVLLQASRAPESETTPAQTLTPREWEVIAAVVDGATNKDIAATFKVSAQTVKNHLSHIFNKLGVSTRLELALYAVHRGLLTDGRRDDPSPARSAAKPARGAARKHA
jgi:DNA-binding NarL/FixJ family response regulator